VQLASAYAVIANGGVLYTPALVKEVLGPDGSVLYQHAPEPVRRVLPEDVAATLRSYLKRAVSTGGTGERAQIQNYELVGKTGTAKVASGGRYDAGQYVASFASIWPADNPQIVAVIKIDRPRGVYYASQTAAPLTSEMLQQALASRNQALKLDELVTPSTLTPSRTDPPSVEQAEADPRVVRVAWPARAARDSARPEVAVPDMTGRDTRTAAAALFAAGLHVKLDGGPGSVRAMTPAAGSSVRSGGTIILHTSTTTTAASP
jgi:membrane peptidoglycan carboxypeptidase